MYRYFDNSATTKPSENVVAVLNKILENNYANPASLHTPGTDSFKIIESAREVIAESISATKDEIIFTSGGTESNNIAIIGSAYANRRQKKKIIITNIEHPSVTNCVKFLEKEGFIIDFISVTKDGKIDEDDLLQKLTDDTLLVSSMLVNNETGLIVDVNTIKRCIDKSGCSALFHIDAVQGYGKIDVNVKKLKCDLLSVSSHKIHGLKGVGALYCKKGTKINPVNYGGNQEKLRSGTQPVELIGAFGQAVKEIDYKKDMAHFKNLREILLSNLDGTDYILNSPENGQAGIVNISFVGIKSEVMLHFLSDKGFYISSGSACSKGKKSDTLKNLGIDDKVTDGALRISMSKQNSADDVTDLAKTIKEGLETLVRKR